MEILHAERNSLMLKLSETLASHANASKSLARRPQAPPSIARHRLSGDASLEARQMLATVNLTAANFSSQLGRVQAKDTVQLAAGTYQVSASQKNTLQQASSLIGVSGKTTLDFRGSSDVQILKISGATGGQVSGIAFLNGGVQVDSSPKFSVAGNTFSGFDGKQLGNGPNDNIVSLVNSDSGSIKNNRIDWTNNSLNVRAMGARDGKNYTVTGNTVSGRLKQGLVVNHVTGGTLANNRFTRTPDTPRGEGFEGGGSGKHPLGEDHGIYVLNVSDFDINNNSTSGWSTNASGHGLKLKDVKDIQVTNNTFASGILGRVNPDHKGRLGFENVTISNNRGGGGILIDADRRAKNVKLIGNSLGRELVF
jgi:hypothetical protein